MQLSSLPPAVISANRDVLGAMQRASSTVRDAQSRLQSAPERIPAEAKASLVDALAAAGAAHRGVEELGDANVLDDTFQRYAGHAVRDLTRAVEMLERDGSLGTDARSILTKHVFDAEVATRMGAAAGERSLASPEPRAVLRAVEFAGTSAGEGPVWVDGAWLDGLGNPVRGGAGDTFVGSDGDGFGPDGEPFRGDDAFVGPDGTRFGTEV